MISNGRDDNMRAAEADIVVSSDSEELILVDADDRPTGTLSKAECHDGDGVLHRAFSVFIFNDTGELLLQQRAGGKRLWPGYWSNSCCSHPRAGENMQDATRRRVQQELGLDAELEFVYKFAYHARFGALGSEHELCWVYLGQCAKSATPNRHEIASIRYVSPEQLDAELRDNGTRYTPWLKLEWERLRGEFARRLDAYLAGAQPT